MNKPMIGWREWVKLPALGVEFIKAKIDTGARTSSLHAQDISSYVAQDGTRRVRFTLEPTQHSANDAHVCDLPLHDLRKVTDSGGHDSMRYVIKTSIELGGRTWPAEITLASRSSMTFRMLLGRTAIAGAFLVDPATSFVTGGNSETPPTLKPSAEVGEASNEAT